MIINVLKSADHHCIRLSNQMDMIFCVRVKSIAYQIIAGWPMFLMYWTGQIIENGVSRVPTKIEMIKTFQTNTRLTNQMVFQTIGYNYDDYFR